MPAHSNEAPPQKKGVVFRAGGLLAASIGVALPVAAQLPPVAVEERPGEIYVAADFTGNNLVDTVIVDRTSGAYRFGRQVAAGVFSWEEPQGSGVGGATSATAGHFFDTARYVLAVTSPEANRISFVDPAIPASGPAVSHLPGSIGPLSMASGQISGTTALEDLLVTTSLNSAPGVSRVGRYRNEPATVLTQAGATTSSAGRLDRAGRVTLKAGLGSTVGYMEETGGSATLRVVSLDEPGSPVRLTVAGIPEDSRYLLVPFAGATHGTLLTYVPGDTGMRRFTILEDPADVYTASPAAPVPLPYPVVGVSAVHAGGDVHLALLREDGSEAVIHRYDGGPNLGPLLQTVEAPSPAMPLSGIVALGNTGGFLALHAPGPGRGTAGAQVFTWDPGTASYVAGALQSFGEIAPRAGSGNVTLLTAEPFVDPAARPVSLRNARDWTSGAPPAPPGTIGVTAELFLDETDGLGDAAPLDLGAFPAGATHSLLNQYHDGISVFALARAGGDQVGQVGISPPSGVYPKAVELRFHSLPAGLTIYYRDAGHIWQTYLEPGPEPDEGDPAHAAWFSLFQRLVRFEETTIEYYGEDGAGRRTPVRRAEYRFTAPPDTLSSLGDHVPDYVKLGLGKNPFRLPDGDASGGRSTSLQHVLDGSGIDPRWLAGTAVDLYVRPLSHDGGGDPATASRLATHPPEVLPDGTDYMGNQVFVYSLSGSLLGQGADPIPATPVRNEGLGIYDPPFAHPSAFVPNAGGAGATVFLAATRPSFALAGALPPAMESSYRGRQLIGLLPLPAPAFPVYTRDYTGGTHADEAAAWVAGATAFYSGEPPPVIAETIDTLDVVAALVFERWLLLRFIDRGLLPGSYAPPTADADNSPPANPNFLSLSGFRARENVLPMSQTTEGPVAPSLEALRALEAWQPAHPAFSLPAAAAAIRDTVRNANDSSVEALRAVALDLFRISAAHGNAFPGAFDPPLDVLRAFLATGDIPAPYRSDFSDLDDAPFTSLTPADYSSALAGLSVALNAPAPRSVQVFELEFRADSLSYPGCLVMNDVFAPGTLYSLFNPDGEAFRLPNNFSILPGTRMEARVFTDAPFPACAGTAVEVIEVGGIPEAEVVLLPGGSGEDTDGNLLGDEWEKAFFGHTGVDPWDDVNNDGYTNLQKYLKGKDPFLFPSYAIDPPANLALPVLLIESVGAGDSLISFEFPLPYANELNFQLFESFTLGGAWLPAPYPVTSPSPGVFEVLVPSPPDDSHFWRIGLSLK